MNYENRYKEALEKSKRLYEQGTITESLAYIFPELRESEDERIKGDIIATIHLYYGEPLEDEAKEMISWLEKQGQTFTKKDIDDAYLRGISDAKHEFEKQGEQNYLNYENINIQQKDFAPKPKETVKEAESNLTPLERKVKDILFSFHINADDGISFDGTMAIVHNLITLCQQEQKSAWSEEDGRILDALKQRVETPADKSKPKFKVKYAGSEYNVFETKDIAGVTFYGIEDEPNHIDYVKADNCEIISVYAIKENGSPYPTKPAVFSEKKPKRMISAEAKEAMYNKPVCAE